MTADIFIRFLLLTVIIQFFAGCTLKEQEDEYHSVNLSQFKQLPFPGGKDSALPNWTVGEDAIYLSWVEGSIDSGHVFYFSRSVGNNWSAPRKISSGKNWFVNWADFPSLAIQRNNLLAAHWLQENGTGTYAYDVRITLSRDAGKSWSSSFPPHQDGTETEHGFVSLLPWQENQFFAAWLDGRNYAINETNPTQPPSEEMTLRAAFIASDGTLSGEAILDHRVCDCCQTAAAATENGLIVLYRDRSPEEIRDIYAVRYQNGVWQSPQRVYADNWEIAGCPVNGPAVAADGKTVVAAWYTNEAGKPVVKASFSFDEGKTFEVPLIIDNENPLGRVDVLLLNPQEALVSWLAKTDSSAEIRARLLQPGSISASAIRIAETSPSRASGFPVISAFQGRVYVAFTRPKAPSEVVFGFLDISQLANTPK